MSEKVREFWISPNDEELDDDGFYWAEAEELYFGDALTKHPQQGPLQWQSALIHVIEYSVYEKLQAMLKIAEEAIELTAQEALPVVKRRLNEALTRISEIKKGTT